MNYFAHGHRFVDDPYFLAGTAVPDLIRVAHRKARVREKHARAFTAPDNPQSTAIAAGIAQHHADDAWFHNSRAFVELTLQGTRATREAMPDDEGFRPSFLGHIMVELLLDGSLIADNPATLDAYYQAMSAVDPGLLQQTVNQMSAHPAERLGECLQGFRQVQFLYDYLDDGKLCYRLNQVMRRVGLPQLPPDFADVLAPLRMAVRDRRHELLAGPA